MRRSNQSARSAILQLQHDSHDSCSSIVCQSRSVNTNGILVVLLSRRHVRVSFLQLRSPDPAARTSSFAHMTPRTSWSPADLSANPFLKNHWQPCDLVLRPVLRAMETHIATFIGTVIVSWLSFMAPLRPGKTPR